MRDGPVLCSTPMQPATPSGDLDGREVEVRYRVARVSELWVLPEGTVPESALHDACVELVRA